MRKAISLLLVVILLLLSFMALAEKYDTYSIDELKTLRDELSVQLSEVSSAYGSAMKSSILSEENISSDENLGSIISIFPDESFAMFVRDELNKFSISQPVTQAELDKIKTVKGSGFNSYQIADLTGVSYLRNVTEIDVGWQSVCLAIPEEVCQLTHLKKIDISYSHVASLPDNIGDIVTLTDIDASKCNITVLPASFTKLVNLKEISFYGSGLTALPDDIGDMVGLTSINIEQCPIVVLPDSVCNLVGLKTLNISRTNITYLPENIGNLVNLKTLDIHSTNITSLPDSIWGLQLDSLNMSGTGIK